VYNVEMVKGSVGCLCVRFLLDSLGHQAGQGEFR